MSANASLPWFRQGSVVYFLSRRGQPEVKIGWSLKLQRRYNELQPLYREMLTFLAVIPGNFSIERAFHRVFHPFAVPGKGSDLGTDGGTEWFRCDWLADFAGWLHHADEDIGRINASTSCQEGQAAIEHAIAHWIRTA
jgi:hypothetical protein